MIAASKRGATESESEELFLKVDANANIIPFSKAIREPSELTMLSRGTAHRVS